MRPITVSIVSPAAPPPEETELAIFSDSRNYVAEYDSGQALSTAAHYAKRYGVYVLPERFIAQDYLCLCMLAPDGTPLGAQQAIHLNLDYRGRFHRADAIEPFDTPFGRVALLVDIDVNLPQVSRAAAVAGAELLLCSQFIQPYDFFEDRVRTGALSAACSNGLALAGAIGAGGIIADGQGTALAGYSEMLPITARLTPACLCPDLNAMEQGRRLLLHHRALLCEETEGCRDE
ncbi:MAG: hypothetical protein RR135_03460 [Oscillospiraceae bacterium]